MFVYVLSKKGMPLMPCKPAIARLLLKQGKAKVKNRMPFIIKMVEDTTEFMQPIVGGMDTGSKNAGCAATANGKVLCETCHNDLHAGKFELIAKKSKTKHATEVGIVKAQLTKRWDFEETFGFETKFKREQILKLSKTHYNDAIAICCEEGEIIQPAAHVYHKRHVASGDYQQTKGIRSEKRIPTGKLFGLKKHDFIQTPQGTGFVKGKRSTGYFALENILGEKIHASANIKKNTVRLTSRTTTLTQQMESASNSS